MSLGSVRKDAEAEVNARRASGKSNFNADKTRYIKREFLGWVCYEGAMDDASKEFRGQRVGVVALEATADRWLAGEDVHFDQKADFMGNLVE